MPYFEFRQNNIHGVTKYDAVLAPYLVIEARHANEANVRAIKLGLDFYEHCACCGYRWSEVTVADELTFPTGWGDQVLRTLGDYLLAHSTNFPAGEPGTLHARAFFLDGAIEEYRSQVYQPPSFLLPHG